MPAAIFALVLDVVVGGVVKSEFSRSCSPLFPACKQSLAVERVHDFGGVGLGSVKINAFLEALRVHQGHTLLNGFFLNLVFTELLFNLLAQSVEMRKGSGLSSQHRCRYRPESTTAGGRRAHR